MNFGLGLVVRVRRLFRRVKQLSSDESGSCIAVRFAHLPSFHLPCLACLSGCLSVCLSVCLSACQGLRRQRRMENKATEDSRAKSLQIAKTQGKPVVKPNIRNIIGRCVVRFGAALD
jgi:hypothetical protein